MKVSRKELIAFAKTGNAIDITNNTRNECIALNDEEGSFLIICETEGTHGVRSVLVQGKITKSLYVVLERTVAMFTLEMEW